MQCASCGADNPEALKFCEQCGAPFRGRCAQCGLENSLGARFCGQCGAPIVGAETAPEASAPVPHRDEAADGERRHLTVLFCDLVNSTEIAARLDPEEWRDIAAQYQRAAGEAAARLGGHVAKYLGDGLMVYFGYPEAHEDDAERAVRAGLGIIEATAALNDRLAAEQRAAELKVRVGIHTGAVVVGQGGGREVDVFGEAPNIAARVQTAALPDTVMVTAAVHQLVARLFVVEDCGRQPLKGVAQPVHLYRVERPSVARQRVGAHAEREMTPFVGREEEMRLLLGRWERAREGQGQVVLVMGEPGVGKSRLVEEFRRHIQDEPHLWVEWAGAQFFASTPFYAVVQALDQGLGWRGDESKEDRVQQLERSLAAVGMKLSEAVPLMAEMLNLPAPEKYPPVTLEPEHKRRRLLAVLGGWLFGAARAQPLVIAVEDLHWVDPSTLSLMQTIAEQGATAPLALLCTTRPEFRAPWPMRAHHALIMLNRLNDRQTREMVAGVAARAALAKDVIDAVVKRADGVPLFAEELTRLMLEGDARAAAREIPATLQDSLTARLDRLGAAKQVAQVAAVIGREFSYELLAAVLPMAPGELQSALVKLTDAELIYARGVAPEAAYQFKHALIQDAAYQALLKSRRRELHKRVARTITEKFAALAEAQPEALARHWTEAGEAEQALSAWETAASKAYSAGAFREAVEGYRQALAMLHTLPESAERDAREFKLRLGQHGVLLIVEGYTAPETVETATRARALAEKAGNLAQLIASEARTVTGVTVSGNYSVADTLFDRLLDLAQSEGSQMSLGIAHRGKLVVSFFRGNLLQAEKHFASLSGYFETAVLRSRLPDSPVIAPPPGTFVVMMIHAAANACVMGFAEKARERIAQASAFARNGSDPYDFAFAGFGEAWVSYLLGDPERAKAAAGDAIIISDKYAIPLCGAWARVLMGWAQAQLGGASEGIALIRQALAVLSDGGAKIVLTHCLSCLAQAQALGGMIDDALGTLEDALRANPEEVVFRPDILTCRGGLRLQLGQHEAAEADFREAIALAREMSAKTFELRAATRLARLLQQRGDPGAARHLLAPLYGWFTEGFDTPDLKAAKALFDQLHN